MLRFLKNTSVLLLLVVAIGAGCTTPATKEAIQSYRQSNQYTELAFNNALRIANEQMVFNLIQYTQDHKDPAQVAAAIRATWKARTQLDICKEQFMYAHSLSLLTVGQYLYDQQGWFNSILAAETDSLKSAADANSSADTAAGVASVTSLIPTTGPSTQPTTSSILQQLESVFNTFSSHK